MRRTGVRVSLYWNFIIHQIFPEFLQPFRDLRIITRVSPFYRGFLFICFLLFRWLGFPQVSPFYHQPTQTLALERCHCQVHLPFLEPIFRLLGEEGEDEEDEEEVSLKLMKMSRKNLSSQEPRLERSSPCYKQSEFRL